MVGFPTPPPLKQKPTLSVIPESVRKKIEHPERITKMIIAFGVVGLLFVLLPSILVLVCTWGWLRAHHVPAFLVVIVLSVIGWYGFSLGMMRGRRIILDALRHEDDVV